MPEVGSVEKEMLYNCAKCGYDFGYRSDIPINWKYCPQCGNRI